jgi:hypothetical protein
MKQLKGIQMIDSTDKGYEVRRIECLSQFLECLPEQNNISPWGYRGQKKAKWDLVPSLFREGLVDLSTYLADDDKIHELRKIEDMLLRRFKAYAQPLTHFVPSSDMAWLALAQHYALPSRLLDWSESPLVGLFFALDECPDECDSALWAIQVQDSLPETCDTLKEIDDLLTARSRTAPIFRYHPTHTTGRITAQKGFFTIQGLSVRHMLPLNQQFLRKDTLGPQIIQYVIPHGKKSEIRRKLDDLGIDNYNVFPDLDGICKKLKQDIIWQKPMI